MGDLLDMGGDVQKPANNLMEEVKELSDLLGTTNSSNPSAASGTLKFQDSHPQDFAPD